MAHPTIKQYRPLPKYFLAPPIFLLTAIFLWVSSILFPYSIIHTLLTDSPAPSPINRHLILTRSRRSLDAYADYSGIEDSPRPRVIEETLHLVDAIFHYPELHLPPPSLGDHPKRTNAHEESQLDARLFVDGQHRDPNDHDEELTADVQSFVDSQQEEMVPISTYVGVDEEEELRLPIGHQPFANVPPNTSDECVNSQLPHIIPVVDDQPDDTHEELRSHSAIDDTEQNGSQEDSQLESDNQQEIQLIPQVPSLADGSDELGPVYDYNEKGFQLSNPSSALCDLKKASNEHGESQMQAQPIVGDERAEKSALDVKDDEFQSSTRHLDDTRQKELIDQEQILSSSSLSTSSPSDDPSKDTIAKGSQWSSSSATDDLEKANAKVEQMMKEMRFTARIDEMVSEAQKTEEDGASRCEGRKVYVYELPAKFNRDLMLGCKDIIPWFEMCEFMENGGLGQEIKDDGLVPANKWSGTHQYALEMVFHARMQEYGCRTTSAGEADMFYVPFYAGLDALRWHFRGNASNEQRDVLTGQLMAWLDEQPYWRRREGRDHVFVLGKISWDFRRGAGKSWGSQLLKLPAMQAPTKLLIERDPWHPNDVGVPHPTFFHPSSDHDVRAWQQEIAARPRPNLASFAGKPRSNQSSAGSLRNALIAQCRVAPTSCFFLHCGQHGDACMKPARIMSLFTSSEFCFQPPGDSPTRRSVFDSLVAGCIPVLFDPYTAYYQYPWHLPADPAEYSVFVPADDVISGAVDVLKVLETIPPSKRLAMRQRIIYDIMPGLLYARPGSRLAEFHDSFDISLHALLSRNAAAVGSYNSATAEA